MNHTYFKIDLGRKRIQWMKFFSYSTFYWSSWKHQTSCKIHIICLILRKIVISYLAKFWANDMHKHIFLLNKIYSNYIIYATWVLLMPIRKNSTWRPMLHFKHCEHLFYIQHILFVFYSQYVAICVQIYSNIVWHTLYKQLVQLGTTSILGFWQ